MKKQIAVWLLAMAALPAWASLNVFATVPEWGTLAETLGGDKVTVWYPSANRDETVFEAPYTFDIFRKKNPHVAFGHGIHHCLGAALARMELRVLFLALIEKMRGRTITPAGKIRFIRSNRHQGVAEMKVRVGQ